MLEVPDSETPARQIPPARPWRMWLADWLLILAAAAAFGLDQLSKHIVRSNLSLERRGLPTTSSA